MSGGMCSALEKVPVILDDRIHVIKDVTVVGKPLLSLKKADITHHSSIKCFFIGLKNYVIMAHSFLHVLAIFNLLVS